ncbi:glycosyltransferase family 39 protein [Candidatus Enterovibrio escicola]|uniref:Glycosyltransferase RgtA/B/C/D-like domain-containing protein n=1 Tax=Candidatus Enterovibrio escicola TaxID=1927127 RepID=A0A2A5T761_9GAMM|nr:glycosyltransferase family 39 protein [Candidatus Enterovibrio escacola]PCS24001.1 hypothetical protein BTN49_0367 [Candidatus Enterovibrio escacola]
MQESIFFKLSSGLYKHLSKDKVYLLLSIIFAILYLPHVFIIVEDLGLILGFEVDPGSHVVAIENLFNPPYYNMQGGYHSKFYGWTYFAINFVLLAPIKLFFWLTGTENNLILYISIRFILFMIGLISVLVFYEIAKKLFNSIVLAGCASILYIISPVGAQLFYFIHPETTGLMFIFSGILALLKFIDNPQDYKLYFAGLICLVLATLSKQIFFFMSLPILFSFLHFYCKEQQQKYMQFVFSMDFIKILGRTTLLALAILFIIHPFAILDLTNFIEYQINLSTSWITSKYAMSFTDSLISWYKLLMSVSVIQLSIILLPITFVITLLMYINKKRASLFLYITNTIGLFFVLCITIIGNRTMISGHYLQPLYPFFVLSLFAIMNYVSNITDIRLKHLRLFANTSFIYSALLTILSNLYTLTPTLITRLLYKEGIAYKTYEYVSKHLVPTDKLVYDQYVALPDKMKSQGCHYWQGCGTDYIDKYQPNYVMFNEMLTAFGNAGSGQQPTETLRLKKYIKDYNLQLIDSIEVKDTKVLIYKKTQ